MSSNWLRNRQWQVTLRYPKSARGIGLGKDVTFGRAWNRPAHQTGVSDLVATVGGAERQLVTLAKGLDRSIFEVTVLCLYGGGEFSQELRNANVSVISLDKNGRWDPGFLGAFWRYCGNCSLTYFIRT